MGGTALKTVTTRLTDRNYRRMEKRVVKDLKDKFPGVKIEAIPCLSQKNDFGDLDILVEHPGIYRSGAGEAMGALEQVDNDLVSSYGVVADDRYPYRAGNAFQVDLIQAREGAYAFTRDYLSYGDAGNLAGCIARALGTRLRDDGLFYYCQDGTHKYAEILLTRDYDTALEFLGFDVPRFRSGLKHNADLFDFVSKSLFFHKDIFLIENRNARARQRLRKREGYLHFLRWCDVTPMANGFEHPQDKFAWLSRIEVFFPHFETEVALAESSLEMARAAKKRLNGDIASQITGLHGPELGALMDRFRMEFPSDDERMRYLINASDDEIADRILSLLGKDKDRMTA